MLEVIVIMCVVRDVGAWRDVCIYVGLLTWFRVGYSEGVLWGRAGRGY